MTKGKRIIAIYFSATDTTKKYVDSVVSVFCHAADIYINLADDMNISLPEITHKDIVILAAPVYGGRLPEWVADRFKQLKGNGAYAISIVVYGNRDYDDALLELVDITTENNFNVVGAAAFIGQHSIFPRVAQHRPDRSDIKVALEFAEKCKEAILTEKRGNLEIKGNRPYKKIMSVGLTPKVDGELCNRCGQCAANCPADAISTVNPTVTLTDKCISCGRCITHCPRHARKYSGLKYKIIGAIFTRAFSKKRESEYMVL
ncbi:MAG: 4Fe-4S binding protein [Paramuribaculum sp.]|nr:4Fe-4S binding protein [Paramuribaculum sp.]